jgi:predicted RNA-binding Zn-ribbon protein involved in translation (DUF1610 family)
MALVEPESMEECLYFSNRTLGELGKAKAWVYKKKCPECGKVKMGKPVVKGKVKIRAIEYICPECDYTEGKKEHEESLNMNMKEKQKFLILGKHFKVLSQLYLFVMVVVRN